MEGEVEELVPLQREVGVVDAVSEDESWSSGSECVRSMNGF